MELEASQYGLEALDNDAMSDRLLETSHETSQLKQQLQSKKNQVQKAQKNAKIQELHSQITETDQQLECLWQQSKTSKSSDNEGSQPMAASTLQSGGNLQQQWLKQEEWDVTDVFLDQLDETPAKDHEVQSDKQSKPAKQRKNSQPWYQLLEQKRQHLDVSEASSDHSSDEPLGESSGTSSSDSDSKSKHSRKHKHSKKCKLKSGMFSKHASTIKKSQLWPHNHLNPHFVSHVPKFQDISWDQLVAGEVAIILQARSHRQAMGCLCLLKQFAYWKLWSCNLQKVRQLYMAVVQAIEEGESSWDSNFQL